MVYRKTGVTVFDDKLAEMFEIIVQAYGNDIDAGLDDVDCGNIAETDNAFQNVFFLCQLGIVCQLQGFGQLVHGQAVFFCHFLADY